MPRVRLLDPPCAAACAGNSRVYCRHQAPYFRTLNLESPRVSGLLKPMLEIAALAKGLEALTYRAGAPKQFKAALEVRAASPTCPVITHLLSHACGSL